LPAQVPVCPERIFRSASSWILASAYTPAASQSPPPSNGAWPENIRFDKTIVFPNSLSFRLSLQGGFPAALFVFLAVAAGTRIVAYDWEALLATAADRDTMDETWENWNVRIEKLIAGLEARSIPYVRVLLDVDEIKQFCEEQGIPNDAKARSNWAIRKGEQNAR